MFSLVYKLNCTAEAGMRSPIHPVTSILWSAFVCLCLALLCLLGPLGSVLCLVHPGGCYLLGCLRTVILKVHR